MSHPWRIRHDHDRAIYRSVVEQNEYSLPDDMHGQVVLDIGGHCGYFARACAERGACVLSFEPEPLNCRVFRENTSHLKTEWHRDGIAYLIEAAVSKESGKGDLLCHEDPAGCTLYFKGGNRIRVKILSMQEAINCTLSMFGVSHIDLCKIDAEGAEYAICETSSFPHTRELAIEFHDGYVPHAQVRAEEARMYLRTLGFVELAWQAVHEETNQYYRLYRGRRDDER